MSARPELLNRNQLTRLLRITRSNETGTVRVSCKDNGTIVYLGSAQCTARTEKDDKAVVFSLPESSDVKSGVTSVRLVTNNTTYVGFLWVKYVRSSEGTRYVQIDRVIGLWTKESTSLTWPRGSHVSLLLQPLRLQITKGEMTWQMDCLFAGETDIDGYKSPSAVCHFIVTNGKWPTKETVALDQVLLEHLENVLYGMCHLVCTLLDTFPRQYLGLVSKRLTCEELCARLDVSELHVIRPGKSITVARSFKYLDQSLDEEACSNLQESAKGKSILERYELIRRILVSCAECESLTHKEFQRLIVRHEGSLEILNNHRELLQYANESRRRT